VVEWNGKPVKAIEKAFANAVADAGLGPDVTPRVLRHTAATWLMQSGTSPWEAAGILGMSLEMLLERYGHHHPDHLSGARKAFAKHREAVAEAVAEKERRSAKCWSERQDLNLRPPRPERGADDAVIISDFRGARGWRIRLRKSGRRPKLHRGARARPRH